MSISDNIIYYTECRECGYICLYCGATMTEGHRYDCEYVEIRNKIYALEEGLLELKCRESESC